MLKAEYTAAMRALADKIDSIEAIGKCFCNVDVIVIMHDKKQLAQAVRCLGNTVKNPIGTSMYFEHTVAGKPNDAVFKISLSIQRNQICKRVVTETVIPAEPEKTITLPAMPERIEVAEDWICDEPLLATGDQADGLRAAVASAKDSIGEEIRTMEGAPL